MGIKLGDIAKELGGELSGDPEIEITGLAGIREAGPGEITFLGDRKYESWLGKTRAAAIIIDRGHPFNGRPVIRVEDPYDAFRRVMEIMGNRRSAIPVGVHASVEMGSQVRLGEGVAIGPNVVIGDRCTIGDSTTIMPGTVIGPAVRIGSHCLVYPNVVIREDTVIGDRVIVHAGAVIGDDGFGFLTREGKHSKVPQLGRVVIEDDVEIGSNTCIDRATLGETRIRRGTRIDNLVQVAHNVSVGENSILCAQVGIAGSTRIGNGVTLAGQVGVVGHIEIGDGVMVGAQGGVTKTIPPGAQVSGYPAAPHGLAKRIYASMRRLPDLLKEVRLLRERVERLERRGGGEK